MVAFYSHLFLFSTNVGLEETQLSLISSESICIAVTLPSTSHPGLAGDQCKPPGPCDDFAIESHFCSHSPDETSLVRDQLSHHMHVARKGPHVCSNVVWPCALI